jgi:hypothetical protein
VPAGRSRGLENGVLRWLEAATWEGKMSTEFLEHEASVRRVSGERGNLAPWVLEVTRERGRLERREGTRSVRLACRRRSEKRRASDPRDNPQKSSFVDAILIYDF